MQGKKIKEDEERQADAERGEEEAGKWRYFHANLGAWRSDTFLL